ncbi:MAG: glutamate--tRNA ligase [Cytophagales bacterium]|nr:glutamate--tRNA ligase [Bernardetiaceae bacterium]MDW8211458.1 glutamate--tRNA ligase [Cytophagales bacterium]
MKKPVRVRFAPSPTGPLHIGGLRTALYNYLFARHYKGTMILRIEDTDQSRYVPGAEEYIRQSLQWCQIELDESPWQGGPCAPYRQSERKHLYAQYVQQLLESGHAYYAFDTPEELEQARQRTKAEGEEFQYNAAVRMKMKNALSLPASQTEQLLKAGTPYVIRFKVPQGKIVRFDDLIRGEVVVSSDTIDDKVLLKSDGMPTYHLANVVDDYLMNISHVIRGEEWLPSTPLHVLLYKAFGWESSMPQFAHLPLLLKPEGEGKLSKRDAKQYGFAVFPLQWTDPQTGEIWQGFREDGYLPEALINFLALLGWNPGTEQEIFSMEELIAAFSLEKVSKAGARFDINKAKWFNQQYLKAMPEALLAQMLLEELNARAMPCTKEKALQIVQLMKDRISFVRDILIQGAFFFQAPTTYESETVARKWNATTAQALEAFAIALEQEPKEFTPTAIKQTLNEVLSKMNIKLGGVLPALRLAITGTSSGPDLMEIIAICGRRETISRIKTALQALPITH